MKSLCDRVIWLDKGSIAAEGDPETVIAQYRESIRVQNQANKKRRLAASSSPEV